MQDKDGRILMRFHQEIPKLVRVGKIEYAFVLSHHISACWIQPEHVEVLLHDRGRGNCCGGRQQFYVASEANAEEWLGISKRLK